MYVCLYVCVYVCMYAFFTHIKKILTKKFKFTIEITPSATNTMLPHW